MGKIKGAREKKLRDDYDFSPKNWLDKRSLVFFTKFKFRLKGLI